MPFKIEAPEAPQPPPARFQIEPPTTDAEKYGQSTGTTQGALSAIGSGALLGHNDELSAGVGAIPAAFSVTDERSGIPSLEDITNAYKGIRDRIRATHDKFAEENPKTDLALQVAGGLATGGAGAVRSVAARGAAKAAGAIVPSATVALAKQGAKTGAVAGAGYTESNPVSDLPGWASDVAKSAAAGAVLAPALPVLGRTIAKAAAGVGNTVRGMAQSSGPAGRILRAMEADGLSVDDARQQLSDNPDMMLANLGPNLERVSRQIASKEGRSSALFTARMAGQQMRKLSRVNDSIEAATGAAPGDFESSVTALDQKMRDVAGPAYQALHQSFPTVGDLPPSLMARIPPSAIASAKKIATIEGEPFPDVFKVQGGKVVGTKAQPTMRQWDLVKRGIDDQIDQQTDQFGNVRGTLGRALVGLKNNLLSELDSRTEINGTSLYKTARQLYADPARMKVALQQGAAFMGDDAQMIGKDLSGMSMGEQQMYRIGASRALYNRVAATPMSRDTYKLLFNRPDMKAKLKLIFPDRQSYGQFAKAMQLESQRFESQQEVLRNSSTNRGEPDQGEWSLGYRQMLDPLKMAEKGMNAARRVGIEGTQDTRDMMGQMLSANKPQMQKRALDQLSAAGIYRPPLKVPLMPNGSLPDQLSALIARPIVPPMFQRRDQR